MKRAGKRRPAALDDVHGKLIPGRLERESQASRRRLLSTHVRAKHESRRTARFGGDDEPLQLSVARLADPGGERVAASRAQRLLARPERITPARRLHDQEIRKIDAARCPGRRIRKVRRRDDDDALAGARQPGEGGNYDRELADAGLIDEKLGEPLPRPAASRQLRVERRETARHGANPQCRRAATPDCVALQDFVEGAHTVFSYSIGAVGKVLSCRS